MQTVSLVVLCLTRLKLWHVWRFFSHFHLSVRKKQRSTIIGVSGLIQTWILIFLVAHETSN